VNLNNSSEGTCSRTSLETDAVRCWVVRRGHPTATNQRGCQKGNILHAFVPRAVSVRRTGNGAGQEKTHLANQDSLSTESSLVRQVSEKAPQVILLENRCFIDRGVWHVRKLRRGQVVELTPWITLVSLSSTPLAAQSVKRDPLDLARLYQSLLDAGLAKTRADVARYFGVSRARVTQVLQRLDR
jgi:hypothetical protein